MFDVIVIGAGVSGLMASGKLAQKGLSVLLLEKMEKPARKLRITGKGRCNITNTSDIEGHLEKFKTDKNFIRQALEEFDSEQVAEFFDSIGVTTKVERGNRLFPVCESAVELSNKFVAWCEKQGVQIKCNAEVESVAKLENGDFEIACKGETYTSSNIVIACGGASYPSTGSTGDGYNFAYDFGHNIISVRPSLVPLVVENCDDMEGLQLKNTGVKVLINNNLVEERFGDVDFTNRGLAGAAIIQISRCVVDAIIDKKSVTIELDFKTALGNEKLRNRISREVEALPNAPFKVLLQKLLPSQLHSAVSKIMQVPLKKMISTIDNKYFDELAHILKNFKIKVIDYRPFKEAIITAGGVDTSEVYSNTMESKLVKGLYFCGEVLDIDSDTGGYNIQLALSTAVMVAKNISK